jgi:hypothetical protein
MIWGAGDRNGSGPRDFGVVNAEIFNRSKRGPAPAMPHRPGARNFSIHCPYYVQRILQKVKIDNGYKLEEFDLLRMLNSVMAMRSAAPLSAWLSPLDHFQG